MTQRYAHLRDETLQNASNLAVELIEQHPDQIDLFLDYLKSQEEENRVLKEDVTCVTWLLQKAV